jgi:DHA3 family macrolide efflux protein-like MFS transporter
MYGENDLQVPPSQNKTEMENALGKSGSENYKVVVINLMYLLLGLSFVFSGILPPAGFILFLAITVFGGISMSIYSGAFTVVMQTMVNASALGRVFSLYSSITLLPSMLGLLATGYIADNIGIANSFIISGIVISFLGLIAFIVPSINKLVKKELSGDS